MSNKYIKLKKYIVFFERPICSSHRIMVETNNISKTKKEYNNWGYVYHRKTNSDDAPSI